MDQQAILASLYARDESAITQMEQAYGPYCAAIARNILDSSEDVEEILSDSWLRAWNSIPPAKPNNLKLYLARITRNLSFDRFRTQSREKRGGGETILALDELSECTGVTASPEAIVEAEELRQALNQFLATQPKRDRQIFLLRYFYMETPDTIARRYAIRPDNVRTILSRTRKKLKQHFIKEGLMNA